MDKSSSFETAAAVSMEVNDAGEFLGRSEEGFKVTASNFIGLFIDDLNICSSDFDSVCFKDLGS